MELHEALTQVSAIRRHMARTETFRGYRAATIAFSGVCAFVAAGLQAIFLPAPIENPAAYLALWIGVAAVCVIVAGAELTWRCRHQRSSLAVQHTKLAVGQFLPCIVAGGLLTIVLERATPESRWMLPGLWAILFSLGVFASCRLLPRPVVCVGLHYLITGLVCLMLFRNEHALSPWAMVLTFGIGQLLTAAILYFTLERPHAEE